MKDLIIWLIVTPAISLFLSVMVAHFLKFSKEGSLMVGVVVGILLILFGGVEVLDTVVDLGDILERLTGIVLNAFWIIGSVLGLVAANFTLEKIGSR